MIRKVFYVIGAAVLGGCYTYAPAPLTAVGQGERARFHVTDEEGRRLAGMLGPQIQTVGGVITRKEEDRLQLVVESFRTVEGGELFGASRALTLDLAAIRSVEMQKIDVLRTVLFAAALVAVPLLMAGPLDVFESRAPGEEEPGGNLPPR